MTDGAISQYLATTFADAPTVLTLMNAMPRKVNKLDLARILVVYTESGALLCPLPSNAPHIADRLLL